MNKIELSTILRRRLTDAKQRQKIMDAMGWDGSNVSRFLSGQMGIPIDKIDDVVAVCGFVPVQKSYLLAMREMSVVGVNCECSLLGKGACGFN